MTDSESELFNRICKKFIKNFLDVIVLKNLEKRPLMGGFDIIQLVHEKFGISISSGTVYAKLYSMERNGLIEATSSKKRRSYVLTDEGRQTIQAFKNLDETFVHLIKKIFIE